MADLPLRQPEPLAVLQRYREHGGSLWEFFVARAERAPTQVFIVFGDTTYHYNEALNRIQDFVVALQAHGVGPGDRVAIIAHNHPTHVFLWFALARLGAVLVPLNPAYRARDLGPILQDAQPVGVLGEDALIAQLRAEGCAGQHLPWLVTLEAFAAEGAQRTADRGDLPRADRPEQTCVLIYTSGTTGRPKGVMHCQRSAILAGEGFVARMRLSPAERMLCILPLFHANALFYSMLGAVAAGATLVLEREFSASRFWSVVKHHRVSQVNIIAAIAAILIRRPPREFVPGHELRKIYGAPLDARTIDVFRQTFQVPWLIEGYGMTEAPGVLNTPWEGPHKPGSMGRPSRHPDLALPFAEAQIQDGEGAPLPPGVVGQLVVRTPILLQGYFRDPVATQASFRDGWFITGDLAYQDGDGDFWFVAREKDIIRRRGENLSGAEIDRVVGTHPDIEAVAAVAVPAPLGEDALLLVVQVRAGHDLDEAALRAWCAQHLPPFKQPDFVRWIDEMPYTPSHRIAKHELRARYGSPPEGRAS